MSQAADFTERYVTALRGYGASLPDDFQRGAAGMEPYCDAAQLEAWADAGIELANHSLRSWEAAAEYFRASPHIAEALGCDGVQYWVEQSLDLSASSSLMAAAYLKATPEVLPYLSEDELSAWAKQGARLCKGNWKSIALSALYYQVSPQLLSTLPLRSVGRLVDVVDLLTERSYELATTCLESAGSIFGGLTEADREPFLRFARAIARASWADTRLYFERGPKLLEVVAPQQRTAFLDLASRVTTEVGRQGFPLFSDVAQAMSEVPEEQHAELLQFAQQLAPGSPTAAMEYLKSTPFVRSRLTQEQMARWADVGLMILNEERNAEGAEAYFRLESARAEEMMRALSARVDLASINTMLRMYAKALSGEPVAVQSAETLVDRNIGWVTEQSPTTEGSAIYLPPHVNTFEEQADNFQVYKVFTTHQTGRLEFGSFHYEFDSPGEHVPATVAAREQNGTGDDGEAAHDAHDPADGNGATGAGGPRKERTPKPTVGPFVDVEDPYDDAGSAVLGGATAEASANGAAAERPMPTTSMQRYFNLFTDRNLIAGLFTVVEDTRIDAYVAQEYGGIRPWLRRLQDYEAEHRPPIESMPMRQAYVENLLRASLGRPDMIRWPVTMNEPITQGLAALKIVEEPNANVQDSAEVAAALYDLAVRIPNLPDVLSDGKLEAPTDDMISVNPGMPGGEGKQQPVPNTEEITFENPPQPEFRGDFKPELVQLLSKLKQQQEGLADAVNSPLTKEQLMELFENSVEVSIGEWAEGDLDNSLGMFLDNLEKDAGTPAGEGKADDDAEGGAESDGGSGEGEDEAELPIKIDWFYYDEWDFRASDYRPRWTRVGERLSEEGSEDFYDDTLQRYHGLVMETRRQFEMMRPEAFKRIRRLEDGHDIDIDQAIEFHVDKRAGAGPTARIYSRRNKIERDVAVAFLLDMSASTDEEIEKQRQRYDDDDEEFDGDPRKYFQWLAQRRAKAQIEPPKRIIDLEKESTVLIVEALEAIGDAYGIYGFSGYGRDNVEFHVIKDLDETLGPRVRKRIDKIEPIRSTRMGPAIRHTITKLNEYDAKVKILILVSDGRPQDHGYGRDRTEKEYAVHDTKQALMESKRDGITPFLITVDKEGHDYLKQMCDDIGYEVVDDLESLPRRLPTLYRYLAAD